MKLIILIFTVLVNVFLIIRAEETSISSGNSTESIENPILPDQEETSEDEDDDDDNDDDPSFNTLTYDTEYPSTTSESKEETPTLTEATYTDPQTDIIASGPGLQQQMPVKPIKPMKPTKKPSMKPIKKPPIRRPVRRPNRVPNFKPVRRPWRRPNMKVPFDKDSSTTPVNTSTFISYF